VPLFGRDKELAVVDDVIASVLAGRATSLLLSGEPGIGKSRLAREIASRVEAAAGTVAWGSAWEAGGAPAYWPWLQALRTIREEGAFGVVDREAEGTAEERRFRLFDDVARRLQSFAAPLCIVLDDLHAADVPSVQLFAFVARALASSSGARLLLVATLRDAEARSSPQIAGLVARFARDSRALSLARLSVDDVAAWWSQRGAQRPAAAEIAACHAITEGNPLFVEEVLRVGLDAVRGARSPLLAEVIDEHLARLSPRARSLLEAAAVLGREAALVDVAALACAPVDEVHAAFAEAVAAGVLVNVDAAPGAAAFRHVLLRDRLYASLPPTRRAELHTRAGTSLASIDVASRAHHLLQAASLVDDANALTDLDRAAAVVLTAAQQELARFAWEEASALATRALTLLEQRGRGATASAIELRLIVAEARFGNADAAEARALAAEAAAQARAIGAHELAARAALLYALELSSGLVDPVMVQLLRDVLAALPVEDSTLRARTMARLASALSPPTTPAIADELMPMARASVAMARRLGDDETLLYTLRFCGSALGYLASDEERTAIVDEIFALADRLGHKTTKLFMFGVRICNLRQHGLRAAAEAATQEMARLDDELRLPNHRWRVVAVRAGLAAMEGRFDDAEREHAQFRAVAPTSGSGALACLMFPMALSQARGDPKIIAPHAERILALAAKLPTLAPFAAWVHAAIGNHAAARSLLSEILVQRGDKRHSGIPWLAGGAAAAILVGDRELARKAFDALAKERFESKMFWGPSGAFAIGPTERLLGDLAFLVGDVDEAARCYDTAIAFCVACGAPALEKLARDAKAKLALPAREPARAAAVVNTIKLAREGEMWCVSSSSSSVRLKHGKGLEYLARLIAEPNRDFHVLDLVGADDTGDAGPVLDAQAKERYRRRVDELQAELDEAERFSDRGRAQKARDELDKIGEQLAGAVGLGGRDRKAASQVERARINVQRRLKDVIARVSDADPALGRYLAASVHTGTTCAFRPV
jgi:hypothetical protein